MNLELNKYGKHLSENIEKLCNVIYMREKFDASLVMRFMEGLIRYLDNKKTSGNISDDYVSDYLACFKSLTEAFEENDYILVADILHHDFNERLLK